MRQRLHAQEPDLRLHTAFWASDGWSLDMLLANRLLVPMSLHRNSVHRKLLLFKNPLALWFR